MTLLDETPYQGLEGTDSVIASELITEISSDYPGLGACLLELVSLSGVQLNDYAGINSLDVAKTTGIELGRKPSLLVEIEYKDEHIVLAHLSGNQMQREGDPGSINLMLLAPNEFESDEYRQIIGFVERKVSTTPSSESQFSSIVPKERMLISDDYARIIFTEFGLQPVSLHNDDPKSWLFWSMLKARISEMNQETWRIRYASSGLANSDTSPEIHITD